jgi:hypothetical protein
MTTPHTVLRAAQARVLRRARKTYGRFFANVLVYQFAKVRWQLETRLRRQEEQRLADKRNKELLSQWN